MVNQELINQANLIITSLVDRLNNSEEWMKNANWFITKEEVEAFCSYYGALPTEVNQESLDSFHKKIRDYYLNSKVCAANISPYFTSDGEIISKFEEEQKKINNNIPTDNSIKNALYYEVIKDLNNARNLEIVVFVYETFLSVDLKQASSSNKSQLLDIKNIFDKVITNTSQIENAKKTLYLTSLSKQNSEFTKNLRALYNQTESLEV